MSENPGIKTYRRVADVADISLAQSAVTATTLYGPALAQQRAVSVASPKISAYWYLLIAMPSEELEFMRENRVIEVNCAASLLREISEGIDPEYVTEFSKDLRRAMKARAVEREDALVDVLSGWFSTVRLSRDPEMYEGLGSARLAYGQKAIP